MNTMLVVRNVKILKIERKKMCATYMFKSIVG